MIEMLSYQFVRNALLTGLMISVVFGIMSFFVNVKKLSFLSVGVSHAAFGGIALGLLLGIHPYLSALVFCLMVAFAITRITERGNTEYDIATGIFFAFSMALGVIFLSLNKNYNFDIMGYLFGSILGVSAHDIWVTGGVSLGVLLWLVLYFKELLFVSFDKEVASASGVNVKGLEIGLIVTVTLLIVISIKMIGIILVTAFLVLPAGFSLIVFRNYRQVLISSIVFSVVVFLSGFLISYFFNLPSGATIVVIATLLYLSALYTVKRS